MTGQGRPSLTVFATARPQRQRFITAGGLRVAISALAPFVACLVVVAVAIAQVPQPYAPMRLRITWGGGAATQWIGRITLDAGTPTDLRVEQQNADSAGSVWLEGRQIVIGSLSARTSDAIEVSVLAAESARFAIELSPGPAARPLQAQISLAELINAPYQLALDDHGNMLTIENVSERVVISTDHEPLIFSPGEQFAFEARLLIEGVEPGTTLDVQTSLSSVSGETEWSDKQRLAVPLDGSPAVSLKPQVPLAEGVYTMRLVATRPTGFRPLFLPGASAPVLAERSFDLVVIDPNSREAAPAAAWENVLEIDPTSPRWWDRLPAWTQLRRIPGLRRGPLGSVRAATVNHPLGQFVELPATPTGDEPHWQAYSLPLEAAGVPHLLEVDYPADLEQQLGLAILEPNSSGVVERVGNDSGVYVEGLGLSDANQKQTHRVVFWPRTHAPLLLVSNLHPTALARFGQIRVLKYPSHRLAPIAANADGHDRLVAAYIGRPRFAQSFGIDPTSPKNARAGESSAGSEWRTLYHSATRLADFVRFAGYNSAVVTIPSESVAFPTNEPRSSTANAMAVSPEQIDSLHEDSLELMLRVFDRERLTFVPAINFATPLPELEHLRRTSDPQTSGLEWVNLHGRTWLQTSGTRNGQAPYYNLLDPRVQQAILRAISDLMDRYGDHASLGGIALQLSGDGYAQLPTPEWGLDDATVAGFERDARIQLQVVGPNRFAERYAAFNGPHAAAWRNWRTAQVTRFYRQLAEVVRGGNNRRRLLITVEQSFDHPRVNEDVLPRILNDVPLDVTLLDLGIDRAMLEQLPGVTFCATRYVAPSVPLQDRAVDLKVNDAFAARRRQAGTSNGAAALLYHRTRPIELASFAARRPLPMAEEFQLACAPLAHGSAIRKPYAVTLADADCDVVVDGGDSLPLVEDPALRATRLLLQHLPVSADVTEVRQQPVVVRSFTAADRVTLLVVNACPWRTEAQLSLDLPGPVMATPLIPAQDDTLRALSIPRTLTRGGPPWTISLAPYDIQAMQIDSGGVRLRGVNVRLSESAKAELGARLADLDGRDPAPRSYSSLANPGFEPQSGVDLPGWRLIGNGTAELSATNPYAGNACLNLQSSGEATTIESAAFPIPPTGQFAMTALVRGRNLAPGSELRMILQADRERQVYRRWVRIGGQHPDAFPLEEQWRNYPILVNNLPLQSGEKMRVQFELSGAGEIWIDEIKTYDLLFTLPFYKDGNAEYWEFVKLRTSTQVDLEKGRIADCVRRLEGYWPRFYTAYTPVAQKRVATQPTSQAEPVSAPPNEPADERSPSLGERIFNRLMPFR
jgi:hypothetical protein